MGIARGKDYGCTFCLICQNRIEKFSASKKFCSHTCYLIHRKQKKNKSKKIFVKKCSFCDKIFETSQNIKKFCSKDCYKADIKKSRENDKKSNKKICKICGKIFAPKTNVTTCSKNCWIEQHKININKSEENRKIKKRINKKPKTWTIEKKKQYQKEYAAKHGKEYKIKNKEKILRYEIERRKNDINFRIKKNLRLRLYCILRKQKTKKSNSTMKLVGCSLQELKEHLEKQFKNGMSWETYGFYGWHVDHIKPCASFDLSNPEEQQKCFHYTNLQPLWAKDNISKSDKII